MLREMQYIIDHCPPLAWSRAGKNGNRFYDKQKEEKLLYGLSLKRQHGNQPMFTKPINVDIVFYMPIPKSMHRRQASKWHTKRPDKDNLTKLVYDAATNILWEDDCIICDGNEMKVYDSNPRTLIIVTELE